jgi:2-(1,2-epoxy-1,2-dihydrophenyl)acetyl-CoA isomerase
MAEVETSREDSVLTITLNRPESYNAFTTSLHAALHAALEEAASPDIRAVVITGAGKGFCAGQDLSEFRDVGREIAPHLEATYHRNVRAIRALEKPVIAAVNGAAAGAGLSLACACDFRIAADTAAFVPGFIGLGLVPDSGGTYFVARLIGSQRAFGWMATNRRMTAAEVHAWGLVDEVVEPAALPGRAAGLAATLAAGPTRGIAMTKRLFDNPDHATLDEQLALEAELQSGMTKTEDFKEGVAAFLEKRPPSFSGR